MMRSVQVMIVATLVALSIVTGQQLDNGRGRGFAHLGINHRNQNLRQDAPANTHALQFPPASGLSQAFWNQPDYQQQQIPIRPPQPPLQNLQRRPDHPDPGFDQDKPLRRVQNNKPLHQQQRTNQNTPQNSHQPIHFRDRQRPQLPPVQRISEAQDIEAIIADALDESKPVMYV